MAKKPAKPSAAGKKKAAAPKAATRTSGVRNSPVPKKVKPRSGATAAPAAIAQAVEITQEMIARRAYEISQSHECGGELDNWLRAERELRG